MIYCMSDIHGEMDRFQAMLNEINFGPEDTLYILGDVIDRNPDGIRILREIMIRPNMQMLLGTHELMMLQSLYYPSDEPDDRIWKRPKPDDPPYFEDRTVIVGHTPTCYMSGDKENPFRIWHGNGLIDIDCGCGNKTELRRLACLRLDDLKEFYI